MIKILAPGGFGNQLFIWALAHKLVGDTNKKIQIFYVQDKFSQPSNYNIIKDLVPLCSHNISVKRSNFLGFYIKLNYKLISLGFDKFYLFRFVFRIISANDISILPNLPKNKSFILIGFFQNYKIVNSVWNEISNEISSLLHSITLPSELELLGKPLQTIHIRRGDYISAKSEFGILTLDYFKKSMENDLATVICTDEQLDFPSLSKYLSVERIYTPTELDTLQTFKLMTISSTLIISNSTFSWWAGFFVINAGGKVVCPNPWFIKSSLICDELKNPNFIESAAEFERLE